MSIEGASVYIVQCSDGSYYTGLTRQEVATRVSEHNNGKFVGHTSKRRPVKLIWSSHFDRIDEAIATERRVKGWSRAKKEAMMREDWDALRELSRSAPRPHPSTSSG